MNLGGITGETIGEDLVKMKYSANSVWVNKDGYDVVVIGWDMRDARLPSRRQG